MAKWILFGYKKGQKWKEKKNQLFAEMIKPICQYNNRLSDFINHNNKEICILCIVVNMEHNF